uniref:Uncharacterized protein n=1 Tax=Haptolina brevifila TaxID=156173 RepID=A0A6U7JJ41_9EUKA|mmetsp:Transcript_64625/g.127705  ORF Transcript_64625/g.127705 Transcript_64625/m.127705 type:complete len:191 (+) Transcript_64625:138-710(+)
MPVPMPVPMPMPMLTCPVHRAPLEADGGERDMEQGVEIPDAINLYDLLAGLLDWDPAKRLKGAALKNHDYWRQDDGEAADWELINDRRLPSPLREKARAHVRAQPKQPEKAAAYQVSMDMRQMAKELSNAAATQAKVDALNNENEGDDDDEDEALLDQYNEMSVDNWEVSSPFAIAREYMESNEQVISVL